MDLGEKIFAGSRNCFCNMQCRYSYMNLQSFTGWIKSENPTILIFPSFSLMLVLFTVIFCIFWVCSVLGTLENYLQ